MYQECPTVHIPKPDERIQIKLKPGESVVSHMAGFAPDQIKKLGIIVLDSDRNEKEFHPIPTNGDHPYDVWRQLLENRERFINILNS